MPIKPSRKGAREFKPKTLVSNRNQKYWSWPRVMKRLRTIWASSSAERVCQVRFWRRPRRRTRRTMATTTAKTITGTSKRPIQRGRWIGMQLSKLINLIWWSFRQTMTWSGRPATLLLSRFSTSMLRTTDQLSTQTILFASSVQFKKQLHANMKATNYFIWFPNW